MAKSLSVKAVFDEVLEFQLARTMHAVHDKRAIHRDLKRPAVYPKCIGPNPRQGCPSSRLAISPIIKTQQPQRGGQQNADGGQGGSLPGL